MGDVFFVKALQLLAANLPVLIAASCLCPDFPSTCFCPSAALPAHHTLFLTTLPFTFHIPSELVSFSSHSAQFVSDTWPLHFVCCEVTY